MIVYSAGTNETALDRLSDNDRQPNGLFTRVLLEEMVKPNAEIYTIVKAVRDRVYAVASSIKHKQLPATYEARTGDFFFRRAAEQMASVAVPPSNIVLPTLTPTAELAGEKSNPPRPPTAVNGIPLPDMVEIPSGSFLMGSDKSDSDASSDERPRHKVQIKYPFALSKTEITFAQYDAFAKATGHELPDDGGWGRGTRPIINVSWDDAKAYAAWLSQQTGKHYRLPTEAEWEYAARAGTTTRYYWGDEIGKIKANCAGCGSQWDNKQTAPVRSFAPNKFDLYDTLGNAWEWIEDCYHDSDEGAPTEGGAWAQGGNCARRVVRGGSWNDEPRYVRSANRYRFTAGVRDDLAGFRLAQD
jgi:formylglycine-generating enzyme required for sulfatase activity